MQLYLKLIKVGQDGEDANQDIRCPICGKNPFQNDEIQIFNIVRVVKFKKQSKF